MTINVIVNDTFIGVFVESPLHWQDRVSQAVYYRHSSNVNINDAGSYAVVSARAHTSQSNIYRSIHSLIFNEFQQRYKNNNFKK